MTSINTIPLLQEIDSEVEDNDILQESLSSRDNKPLFKPIEPRDKFYTVYLIFYMLGVVSLVPWNFYVTANDYWMYKFRDTHSANSSIGSMEPKKTVLQAEFTSYITAASAIPSLIFMILNVIISRKISANIRIIGSLFSMLILMMTTLAFVLIDTDKWQFTFFIISLTIVVLLNVCSAILSGSIFGIVGNFSPIYITATIGGQALGGIFAAVAEIASLAIGASSTHSALVYFIIGNVTIGVTIVLYIVLTKTIFYKYHIEDKFLNDSDFANTSTQTISYQDVFKRTVSFSISMFLVFFFTLTIYPGVTVLIESEGRGNGRKWNDVYFVPTVNYLLFSIGDYVGRITAGKIQKPKNETILLILSASRFIFIPLLMLCNAHPRHLWAVVFDKDYQYIIIILFCALTNGYLANLSAILAPKKVNDFEKETASLLVTVFMGMGLAFGSGMSLVMVKFL